MLDTDHSVAKTACFLDPVSALVRTVLAPEGGGKGLARWFKHLHAGLDIHDASPRAVLASQCLAHLAGRCVGRGKMAITWIDPTTSPEPQQRAEMPGIAATAAIASRMALPEPQQRPEMPKPPDPFLVPFVAGVLHEGQALGCRLCQAWMDLEKPTLNVRGLVWLSCFPVSCLARCRRLDASVQGLGDTCDRAIGENQAYQRGQAEFGVLALSVLRRRIPLHHREIAEAVVNRWLKASDGPVRRFSEGQLPLLAIRWLSRHDPEAPAWPRVLFRDCRNRETWATILRNSRNRAGFSALATAYWTRLWRHPAAQAAGIGQPERESDLDDFWDSESDRRQFQAMGFVEAWLDDRLDRFASLSPADVRDLPTLFLALRLREALPTRL